jgi:hypothetical protein
MEKNTECPDIPSLNLPDGWSCIEVDGPGPFATRAVLINPEGVHVPWNSRDHRKHHNLLDNETLSTWWAPGAVAWWIGLLFAIGATCFAVGAIPGYLELVGQNTDALTFFVGSIFFTTAAFLQYIETINARKSPKGLKLHERIRFFTWEPRRIDWLSAVVQFIGTVFFNISTFYAMGINMTVHQINHQIWAPDIFGSICFLIASGLVWVEVSHGLFSRKLKSISWEVAFFNLAGSIAFGFSAVTAFYMPLTGHPLNATIMNMGTFVGGICFLIGAVLLLPERTHPYS